MLDIIRTRIGEIRLVGEIDMGNADRLATALSAEQQEGGEITLNLSEVDFMDSTGLKVLLDLSASYPVIVVQPSGAVRRLFETAIPDGASGLKIIPGAGGRRSRGS